MNHDTGNLTRFSILNELWRDTVRTSSQLFKITVPAVIVTKLLEEFGMIGYLSQLVEPIMALMGLPGALGIVWATASDYLAIQRYRGVCISCSDPGTERSPGNDTLLGNADRPLAAG